MHSSDSEDFESADEGHGNVEKKERKTRITSSNYSENTLDSDQDVKITPKKDTGKVEPKITDADGWGDFDLDDEKPLDTKSVEVGDNTIKQTEIKKDNKNVVQSSGWDEFDDWGQEEESSKIETKPSQITNPTPQINTAQTSSDKTTGDIKEITERLAATSTGNSGGWGWGWGVDSLLSTATAGISTLTSQVSQGLTTVLETGLGAPDPEELARKSVKQEESISKDGGKPDEVKEPEQNASFTPFGHPFGSLVSGVTKFVETTGTKVIAGSLDTLETIGKKTMEVLQDGDPGLAKKRAMLGLDPGEKLVLSQVLREAKTKAEEEDRIREEKREAKEVHYENLFDDFEGLVHLEALEMLSRQVNMRIEERIRCVDSDKRQDIKETLQQVAELCEIPEEDEDDEPVSEEMSKSEAFHDRLITATQDIGLKMQFQPLVKQYTELLDWLSTESVLNEKVLYKKAVSSLAQATALSVEIYHKTAEMLLVKTRRSTADEADALTQMTVVLTKHISELATLFTEKLNTVSTQNKEQANTYITNVFLEAGNSSTYIQNAFQLALPILQIGAV